MLSGQKTGHKDGMERNATTNSDEPLTNDSGAEGLEDVDLDDDDEGDPDDAAADDNIEA